MFSQVIVWCSLPSGGIPEKPRRVTDVLAFTRTCTRFVFFIIFPGFGPLLLFMRVSNSSL